jgi:hypothetical protein
MKNTLILTFFCFFNLSISFGQNKPKDQFLIKAIDLGLFGNEGVKKDYYGLFYKVNQYTPYTRQEFELKKIDLRQYLPQTENPDYDKIKRDNLLFVLSGFDSLKEKIIGWIPGLSLNNMFPGDSFIFEFGKNVYSLYAKGEIINNDDSSAINVVNGIRDYRLYIRTNQNEVMVDQTIYQSDFIEPRGLAGYIGQVTIEWIGDLNGDNELEIIMSELIHHECYQLKLLSSNNEHKIVEIYKVTVCGG